MSESTFPAMARIPGLESDRIYRVRALVDAGVEERNCKADLLEQHRARVELKK